MIFEVSKVYKHTSGILMKIIGEVKSSMYGDCLVAEETGSAVFRPVSRDEAATVNWTEVSKEEWTRNFKPIKE